MKVIGALLFVAVAHSAAGFSSCPLSKISLTDIFKYTTQSIDSYGFTSVPREDVTFRLWTRDSNTFTPLFYGYLQNAPSIKPNKPFKFIIHGWTQCAKVEWYKHLKDEYLKKGDYNVIQVDWEKAAGALYPVSAGHTRNVGQYIGELIVDLNKKLGVPFENIHIIGHSLGAHISGFAGKQVKKESSKMVGRITGLDPAGPLFLLASASSRLNRDDALFVDVIHTDGTKFGYPSALGHVDFYPNGRDIIQPRCTIISCSHNRAHRLFGESINSEGFIGRTCPTYRKYNRGECQKNAIAIMGENIKIGTEGVYYLKTSHRSPFAKNDEIQILPFLK